MGQVPETRRRRVLRYALALYSPREIAAAEGCSVSTVKRHLRQQARAWGCLDRHDLPAAAMEHGVAPARIVATPRGCSFPQVSVDNVLVTA